MSDTLLDLTAKIVSAHLANNTAATAEIPGLINSVYSALSSAGTVIEPEIAQSPAVPIKKSVFPDYIVCLEDGKKLKMLKRHLKTSYDMSPDDYRAKWKLPADYPMVAPSYAAKRSTLAKSIGLGRKRGESAAETIPKPAGTKAPARKARGSKG